MPMFGGCDWGKKTHAACVVDERGAVRWKATISHDAAGLEKLVKELAKFGPPADLPIAIECPTGLLVDTLVEAGHPVVPLHPNVVKACRTRYRAAGGKDDLGDGYMLADILRTDGHRFTKLHPQSDALKALRALVHARDSLVAERVAMANQLRSLLESCWPGATEIFAEIDSPIALAFLQRYPTAESASKLGEKRLASFLAQHSYPGRRKPAELLTRLREAARSQVGELEAEAKGEIARALTTILEKIVARIQSLTSRIEHDVEQLPEGRIVMSLPRSGHVNAAQILVELGDQRARFVSDEHLAAEAGVVPVTYASGKHRAVVFRWACNHRLRAAITTSAHNSRFESEWAKDVYRRARARGCDHPHATRILSRAWLRVLYRLWQTNQPYDVARHRAAGRLTASA
jgi:transposase